MPLPAHARQENGMSNQPIYEMLAQAFAGEGVDHVFNLMGDGNMHWATAIAALLERVPHRGLLRSDPAARTRQ
jgi:hypothetical protein